jgi:hypothetical protein
LASVADGIERFFLDVIGYVLPGLTLTLSIWLMLGEPTTLGNIQLMPLSDSTGIIGLVVLSYVLGYPVIAIGDTIITPLVRRVIAIGDTIITPLVRRVPALNIGWRKVTKKHDSLSESPKLPVDINAQIAIKQIKLHYPHLAGDDSPAPTDLHYWRNIALSIVQDQTQIVYRFMAVAQLNLGIAAALWSATVIWLLCDMCLKERLPTLQPFDLSVALCILVASLLFLNRHGEFYRRSISLPFSMVSVRLNKPCQNSNTQTGSE